ncbi:hypothetical protein GQ42DRAFT_161464 [Ramicandelaber brevisporus]|nr:hypothetical protein GQ42DRAFT_161464 [Ramicandelaber brevisporus]
MTTAASGSTNFGTELKSNQLGLVNQYVLSHSEFLSELRDFVKDRAALESEYASKLSALAKRLGKQRDKRAWTLSIGSSASNSSGNANGEVDIQREGTTFLRAVTSMINSTEEVSKSHSKLGEQLANKSGGALTVLYEKSDESRKKSVAFAQQLLVERDKEFGEKDKAKKAYEEIAVEVQSLQNKQERFMEGGKSNMTAQDKIGAKYEAKVHDKHALLNQYILANASANEHKKRYYNADVPEIMSFLQQLQEDRLTASISLLKDITKYDEESNNKIILAVKNGAEALEKVDAGSDSKMFVLNNVDKTWQEPADFQLVMHQASGDGPVLVTHDDEAITYLRNLQTKLIAQNHTIQTDIDVKFREMASVQNQQKSTGINSGAGSGGSNDPVELGERVVDIKRQIMIMETTKSKLNVCINLLTDAVGELDSSNRHRFKNASFAIPTTCDQCQTKIWGVSSAGLKCEVCGFCCHLKCEMQVPANCTSSGSFDHKSYRKELKQKNKRKPVVTLSPSPSTTSVATESKSKATGASIGAAAAARRESMSPSMAAADEDSDNDSDNDDEDDGTKPSTRPQSPASSMRGSISSGHRPPPPFPARRATPAVPGHTRQTSTDTVQSPTESIGRRPPPARPSASSTNSQRRPPPQPPAQQKTPSHRTATALYDYAGDSTGAQVILGFRTGDVITVLGGGGGEGSEVNDGSGWLTAMLDNGSKGLVPSAYVELSQIENITPSATSSVTSEPPPPPMSRKQRAAAMAAASSSTVSSPIGTSRPGFGDIASAAAAAASSRQQQQEQEQEHTVKALYDFAARNQTELGFNAGDVIVVTDEQYADGWMEGYLQSDSAQVTGVFPANYVSSS